MKQENEKQDELKRSAVRAVLIMRARVPTHDRSQKTSDLMEIIRGDPALLAMLESYEKDVVGGRAAAGGIENVVAAGTAMETE